jgi:hypothetical protein
VSELGHRHLFEDQAYTNSLHISQVFAQKPNWVAHKSPRDAQLVFGAIEATRPPATDVMTASHEKVQATEQDPSHDPEVRGWIARSTTAARDAADHEHHMGIREAFKLYPKACF